MQKLFKKIGCFLLVGMLAAGSLTGCNTSKTSKDAANSDAVPKESYEINWYFMGNALRDTAAVEAAVNEYLKDKLNVTLKLNRLENSAYERKMNTIIAASEYFDIAFSSTWALNYTSTSSMGAWIPLDEFYDKYMPKTKAMLGNDILNIAKVKGKVYGIPANKEMATQVGWIYRSDIAEKYNINMNEYKDLKSLMPVLKMIKEKEPDMQYPIDWDANSKPTDLLQAEYIGYPAAIFPDKYPGKVVNILETPEYVDMINITRQYYVEGLVKKDVYTAKDLEQRVKDGKTFCYLQSLKPGKANELATKYKVPLAQAEVTKALLPSTAGLGSMMAISRTSKNPERVAKFLEMFNNDPYLNNLIVYGIDGKHYKKVDDKYIDVIPGTGYTLAGSQWMMGNVFNNYLTVGEEPDKMEKLKKFNESAVKPQNFGFVPETESFKQDTAACITVKAEYGNMLALGAVPIEEVLPKFKDKLRIVGAQKIIDELQRQYDEWYKQKK